MRQVHLASIAIFDLDGTLIDTLGITYRCFQEAVAPALGRTPEAEEILKRFGPADQAIVREWVGPHHAEAAVERLYACYRKALGRMETFPGIADLLDELRPGRTVALFTGRGRPSTDLLLQALDLGRLFDLTLTGEEARHPKPAPDGILQILEQLEATGDQAFYVGDSAMDLQAAAAAGVQGVAALWGNPEPEKLREAAKSTGAVAAATVSELRSLLLGSGGL